MKIALLLSGQVREIEKSFPAIKKCIITPTDCDIFARVCKDEHTESLYPFLTEKDCVGWEVEEDFLIDSVRFPFTGSDKNNRMQRYYQQLYGIYKVNEQRKKHDVLYDLVIRCRLDLKPVTCLSSLWALGKNTLYTPICNSYGGLNDQFAIGSPEVIDVYANRFNIIKNTKTIDNNSEQQLYRIIREHNIDIKLVSFNYDLVGRDVGSKVKEAQNYKEGR